jgi:hypothetical protein
MNPPEKILAYAYPTSTNAKLLGFAKTGCWYVGKDAFLTRDEAVSHGNALPGAWSYWSMSNPRFTHAAERFNVAAT